MRYRGIVAALAIMASNAAQADVSLPYFDKIKEKDLCGGVPKYCQPNASKDWSRVKDPLDYNGDPSTLLGRKYETIYSTKKCTGPLAVTDYDSTPPIAVNGTVVSIKKPGLSAKINADLEELANQVGIALPEELKLKLKAALGTDITQKLDQSVAIKYQRIQMNMAFKDDKLPACLAEAKKKEKVVTGISVISVSAQWTKDRLSDALHTIELDAAFSSLSAETRVAYDKDKQKVLTGSMPETSFVIMASYDVGEAPNK